MFSCETYDALIVGARCAGAATAMLLARHGLRVLAIDRAGYGTDTVSTHALMRGGVLQLHRWGVLPGLQAIGTPAVRTTTFHYGDDQLTIPIKPAHGVPALYAPRRTVLDRALVAAALNAGATVRHGCTLVDLIHRPDGRVAGATVLDAADNACTIKADLVIGADGVLSSVARLAGAAALREGRHATAVVFGYFSDIELADFHWWYRPGVGAGVIPTNAGRHCVFVAVSPQRLRQGVWRTHQMAAFHAILREADPALAAMVAGADLDGPLRVFSGRKSLLRQPYGPGWALVGDAGYFKDPITAHGITDALRDAELLANAVASGTTAGLAEYAATRDALSLPLFEVSDAIAGLDWTLDEVQALHQSLNCAMKQEVEHLLTLRDIQQMQPEEELL